MQGYFKDLELKQKKKPGRKPNIKKALEKYRENKNSLLMFCKYFNYFSQSGILGFY